MKSARSFLSLFSGIFAAAVSCLLPHPTSAQTAYGANPADNPTPRACCPCTQMTVNGLIANKPGIDIGTLYPDPVTGIYTAQVDVQAIEPVGVTCPPLPFRVTVDSFLVHPSGIREYLQSRSTLIGSDPIPLEFTLTADRARHGDNWQFQLRCGGDSNETSPPPSDTPQPYGSEQNCPTIEFPLGTCRPCESASCELTGAVDSQSGCFSVTLPTTTSFGGQASGQLRFFTPTFANPGRSALIVSASPAFTITRDANGFISLIDTGAATIEVTPAAALLATDPNAFTITHKDPSGVMFRKTTISFVNEGGQDRLRMDTLFDGTTTRHEQRQTQPGTFVLEKGRATPTTFEPLWRETYDISTPAPGTEIQRRRIEQRASISHNFQLTSDIQTTWENQIHGWVKIQEIIDPTNAALTSTWSYYQPGEITGPGGSTNGLARLKQYLRYDGYREFHTYQQNQATVTRPYAGDPAGQITTTTWNPGSRTSTVVTQIGTQVLSKTTTAHTPTSRSVTTHTSSNATLTTTTHYHPSSPTYTGDFGGKPIRVQHPDGTLTTYTYTRDPLTGGFTTTMDQGATTDQLTVSEGLRTTTIVNSRGTTIFRQTQAIGFGPANGETFDQMAVTAIDNLGRALTTDYHPATVIITGDVTTATGAAWQTTNVYACCGLIQETDMFGVPTFHAYDILERRIKTNRLAVTHETIYDGLTTETHRYPETVTANLSATLVDDDSNLVGRTSRNLSGTSMTSSSPDPTSTTPGALVDTSTAITYQPAAGLSMRSVTTTPDTFSQTTDSFLDGRTATTAGALAPAMTYSYTVNATGAVTTRSFLDGATLRETTTTTSDWAGRQVRVDYMDGSFATMTYNALGQMDKSIDPDNVTTRYAYNTRGQRTITAVDLNANSLIDYGTDSISFSETIPALNGLNDPVWQTTSKVWQDGQIDPAIGTTVSTSLRSPDGLSSATQALGVANPSTSLTTLAGNGNWTEETTNPDGTDTLTTYTAGLLATTASRTTTDAVIESVAYAYDPRNRPVTTTHSRTGVATTAYLSATADVVASVTDPGNRETTFTYDIRGRRTHVDAPNTPIAGGTSDNITVTIYNPDSTVQETTGDQTYRVTYTYDYADRMKTMTTYGTTTAETEWIYSPDRGFMTRKEYADNEGTNYTYTPAGRLATRTWERGITTTYGYDNGGRLETTDYSDATPDLVMTYDALNRQTTVTRGGVLHASYDYDPTDLVLTAERQQIDTLNRTLERTYDTYLRPTGHTAGTPDATDPFTVDTPEATATWTRDTAGRLDSLTDGNHAFTYGYTYQVNGAGNHQGATAGTLIQSTMPFTLDGPEIDTTLEYDPTRNVLLSRENSYDSGVLSDFAYSVNAIGQRDGLTTTGDAFTTALDWEWTYNARGELVQADDQSTAGNDRAYEFDGIGNRKKTTNGLLGDLPTTDNWAANSLNQYSTVANYTPAPVHDNDGNLTTGPLPAAPSTASSLAWDGENRLISATVGATTITYTYDHLSRLTSATTGSTTVRYLYDGWNRIAEYNGSTQIAAYLWGLDLSNTPQGAGGVGGLLSISAIASGSISDTFYPAYDGNGNVSEYVNAAGAEVAHFEYDPFGNLTVDDQGNAASFPYRFSTKPQDAVTGLYYYGYRYYDPVTGRWPSRDPIGERGGVNLYGFVRNDGVGRWDFLGLDESKKVIAITKVGEPKLQGFDLGVINPNDPNVIDVTKALGISVKELVKKLIGEEGQAIICTSHVDFIKQMEALKLKANFGWPIWNLQKYVRKRRS